MQRNMGANRSVDSQGLVDVDRNKVIVTSPRARSKGRVDL
jgi:hypothetical protein